MTALVENCVLQAIYSRKGVIMKDSKRKIKTLNITPEEQLRNLNIVVPKSYKGEIMKCKECNTTENLSTDDICFDCQEIQDNQALAEIDLILGDL